MIKIQIIYNFDTNKSNYILVLNDRKKNIIKI